MIPWLNPSALLPKTDVAKAKSILDAAGWVPGPDGIRVKNGQKLVLTANSRAVFKTLFATMQSLMQKIGIQVDITELDTNASLDASNKGQYHINMTGDVAKRSRRMTEAFENYSQMRVLKRPLTGLYLGFFLLVTLFILVGSLWMGSYLAKRITRPVQALAAAAREIGAGHLDQRVEPQSSDEFGSLVEAFNTMSSELAATRRRVDQDTIELERRHGCCGRYRVTGRRARRGERTVEHERIRRARGSGRR